MTVVPAQPQAGASGARGTSGLYDVLELVLDRGLVIDAFVRVSLVGIEILKIDVRVVVASVDTYLRFAEACNRLDLEAGPQRDPGLPELVGEITESGSRGKSKGALSGVAESVSGALGEARDKLRDASKDREPEGEPETEGGTEPRRAKRAATSRRKEERD